MISLQKIGLLVIVNLLIYSSKYNSFQNFQEEEESVLNSTDTILIFCFYAFSLLFIIICLAYINNKI